MRILEENKFNEVNFFGKGQPNDRFAQYFIWKLIFKSAYGIWKVSGVSCQCNL